MLELKSSCSTSCVWKPGTGACLNMPALGSVARGPFLLGNNISTPSGNSGSELGLPDEECPEDDLPCAYCGAQPTQPEEVESDELTQPVQEPPHMPTYDGYGPHQG